MRKKIRLYNGAIIPTVVNGYYMMHYIDKANIIRHNHKKVEIGFATLDASKGAIFTVTDTIGNFCGTDSLNFFYKEPVPINIVVIKDDGWSKHFKSLESCCDWFGINKDTVLELIESGKERKGYYFDEDFY